MSKILIIDDERDLVALLAKKLRTNGHEVFTAYDGRAGAELARRELPDLILLDIMMPEMDGFDVCRAIRDEVICPILFLSARQAESDKIQGLTLGGDDYITKPFGMRELMAKIEANLRRERRAQGAGATQKRPRLYFGEIALDLRARCVQVGDVQLALTKILAATVGATLVTYLIAGAVFLLVEDRYIQPANYNELQVENVEVLARDKSTVLLNASAAPLLDAAVGDSALKYQVVDAEGRTLYGTYAPENVELDGEMLLQEVNTAHGEGAYYVHTVPILDDENRLVGAVRCAYDFDLRFTRTTAVAKLATVFFVVALASPLLWLGFFSWFFSRRFAAQIRTPLALLRGAADKIAARDLDFTIDYTEDNELGELCTAFDAMRANLGDSLARQWRLEKERREMVAALAHDLKTPLAVIKAYNETLADDTPLDEEQRGYVAVIAANVDRSAGLIQRIQNVSLLEAGAARLDREWTDLRAFLAEMAEALAGRARLQQVEVALLLDAGLARGYLIDRERLWRMLDNLVNNALAVMRAGGRLTLAAKEAEDALLVAVRDSGPGFSAKDLRHATEQFYRGDEARGTRDGHAGLGLFIVQTLAEQMGGRVLLSNNGEGGACVTIALALEFVVEKGYNEENNDEKG